MIKTSFFLFILVIQLWPACSDEPSVDLHCLHECSCTEWELKRINQFADTYSFLSTAFDAYYSACNGIKSYDIQLDETGCQIVNCTGGIVLADANTTCIEIRDYPPDALCSIYYRAPHFSVYFTDDGWEFEMYCVEVVFERIDVADDVLILETASDVVTRISKVLTDSDSGASMISKVEGVLLSLVSNQDNEGSGFRVLFNSYDTCGDGFVDYPQEECDIWTNTYEIYCNACCQISEGAVCSELCGRTTECHTACGDGVVQSELGEECDPGDVEDYLCQNCLVVDDVRYDNFTAFCDSSDPPLLTEPSGTIFSGYAADAYCYWSVLPSDNECLVWAIDENDIANEDIFIYSYPDFDEICHTLFTDVFCEGTTYSVGDYMPLSVQQAYVVLSANGDAEVGAGLHWEYSTMPDCGNGVLDGMENCDDGNRDDGDGCSACCVIETGYTCAPAANVLVADTIVDGDFGPSTCVIACGDNVVEHSDVTGVYEECDDGNDDVDDGCVNCHVEEGYVCEGSPSVCHAVSCGNGFVEENEECDDGNPFPRDGCYSCRIETAYYCEGSPSVCECFTGTRAHGDGTCSYADKLKLEVRKYDSDDCNCYTGGPLDCCLFEALRMVPSIPSHVPVHICLGADESHRVRGSSNLFPNSTTTYLSDRVLFIEPCKKGDIAVIDLGFSGGLFLLENGTFAARNLTIRYSLGELGAMGFEGSVAGLESLHFERCVGTDGAAAVTATQWSNITMMFVSVVDSFAHVAPVSVVRSHLYIDDSVFFGNFGGAAGGVSATFHEDHQIPFILIDGAFFGGNVGFAVGGAVCSRVEAEFDECLFVRNLALAYDGTHALCLDESAAGRSTIVDDSGFVENGYRDPSSPRAFGITTFFAGTGADLHISDSWFVNNSMVLLPPIDNSEIGTLGGALFVTSATHLYGNQLEFESNSATKGGAVHVAYGVAYISESYFANNRAVYGGAFYLNEGVTQLELSTTLLHQNRAQFGSTLYSTADAETILLNVYCTAPPHEGDIVGDVQKCDDDVLCGQYAMCDDTMVGVECTCPPGTYGDPLTVCYGNTALALGLLNVMIERTLTKPDTDTECLFVAGTGGLGKEDGTVHWRIAEVEYLPSETNPATWNEWLVFERTSGAVEAGYCGSVSDEPTSAASSSKTIASPTMAKVSGGTHTGSTLDMARASNTGITLDNSDSQSSSLDVQQIRIPPRQTNNTWLVTCQAVESSPDVDLLPISLSTFNLTQGEYLAVVHMVSDSDTVRDVSVDIRFLVLTEGHGPSSTIKDDKGLEPEFCSTLHVIVDNPLSYVVFARDVEGIPLGHGGDTLRVWASRKAPVECGGSGGDVSTSNQVVQLLSFEDRQTGEYAIRVVFVRSGDYWVHISINGEDLENCPLLFSATCEDGKVSSESGVCESQEHLTQTLLIGATVLAASASVVGGCFYVYRKRGRKTWLSERGLQVLPRMVGVLTDVGGVISEWVALFDVLDSETLRPHAPAYAFFVSLGTVLVSVLTVSVLGMLFFPKKTKPLHMMFEKLRGLLFPVREDSDLFDVSLSSTSLDNMYRNLDDMPVKPRMSKRLSTMRPAVQKTVSRIDHELDTTQTVIRNLIWGIVVVLLKDIPLIVISVNIVFHAYEKNNSVIVALCLSCINMGMRLQGMALIIDTRKKQNRLQKDMQLVTRAGHTGKLKRGLDVLEETHHEKIFIRPQLNTI
eukprot:Rmarinus@m.28871